MKTYKLVPLSGDCGVQVVDGYAAAQEIAQEIAQRNQTEVVVSDAEGRTIIWRSDGSHRAIYVHELRCFCPDDCNCRKPWRPTYCGCKQHEGAS